MRKLLFCAIAALAALAVAPGLAQAAVFTVNTTADTAVPDGCTVDPACSLRDAVTAANAGTDAEDTIVLPAGNYVLTAGELNVDTPGDALLIDGANARTTTIDAEGNSRVFDFIDGDIRVDDMTITGGSATSLTGDFPGDGGGILTRAPTLALDRVTLGGNSARLNGGGLAAPPESGTATEVSLTQSTVAGNTVTGGALEGLGGGLYVLGDLNVTNSTISGNSIDNPGIDMGGGIVAAIDPAETDGTTLSILNATVAGNSVPAGGMGGGIAIVNPTPGVVTTVDVKNTIVAANTAGGAAADCSLLSLPASDNNLSGDASCQFADEGSLQSTDPQLGALADNGGPTNTRSLAASSPAIDAGTNEGCPPTDQRGEPRPQGPACDIGAFEAPVPPPPPAAASADLAVKLKARPKKPRRGGKVKYKVALTNRGPDAAAGTTLRVKLPATAKRLKGAQCDAGKPKKVSRRYTCSIGDLAAGEKVKLKARAKIAATAKNLRANAKANSATADPARANNRAKSLVKVKRRKR